MTLRWIVGSLLLVGSLLVGADRARAQVCGDLAVAEAVSEAIFGHVAEYGSIEPSACAKIAKGGAAACHRRVTEVATCTVNQSAAVFRMGNLACRGDDGDPSVCSANYRELLDQVRSEVGAAADPQHALCDDLAADFFGDCLAAF